MEAAVKLKMWGKHKRIGSVKYLPEADACDKSRFLKNEAGFWEDFAFPWVSDIDSESVGNVVVKVSCCIQ